MFWTKKEKHLEKLLEWTKEIDVRVSRIELAIEKIEARKKIRILKDDEKTEETINNDGLDEVRKLAHGKY